MRFYEGDTELDSKTFDSGWIEYTFEYCVDPSVCHKAVLEDSFGDGIGGVTQGLKVYLNGGLVGENPIGNFWEYVVDINCN